MEVLATDIDGSSTLSAPDTLLVDGVPPPVRFGRADGGSAVMVRVIERYSEVDEGAVRVSFGDGHSAHGRAHFKHRYARAGVYHVIVRVRDEIGNSGVTSRWVSVR